MTMDEAIDCVAMLSRTQRYPKTTSELQAFARGLMKACEMSGVAGERIVAKCSEISVWCPTDADLINVGMDIARLDAVAAGNYDSLAAQGNAVREVPKKELEKHYGKPKAFDHTKIDAERAKGIRERERQMWTAIRVKIGKDPQFVSWNILADAAEELGYTDYARAWRWR
jgi:hypothetical protein